MSITKTEEKGVLDELIDENDISPQNEIKTDDVEETKCDINEFIDDKSTEK